MLAIAYSKPHMAVQRIDKYDVDRILEAGSSQLESNSISVETINYLCGYFFYIEV